MPSLMFAMAVGSQLLATGCECLLRRFTRVLLAKLAKPVAHIKRGREAPRLCARQVPNVLQSAETVLPGNLQVPSVPLFIVGAVALTGCPKKELR